MQGRRYILTISCPDRVGIVAAVSTFIASQKGWITEASHHADPQSGWFFMRHEVLAESLPFDIEEFRRRFRVIADEFGMVWQIADSLAKKKVAILVSKQDHCLSDLLHRWRTGELDFDLRCVVSNHEDLRSFVEWHQVPFHCVAIEQTDRDAGFKQVDAILEKHGAKTVVLARYMQILPGWMCDKRPGGIINIHHSFLPSFAGAKPYHQAYERGVKLIGASCHYVTPELDAGPIIEQDVIRVDHGDTIEDLIRLGRDVEKTVLSRGLRLHIQDRVLIHENKTVVFQ
ncbi:MAG: formyltetrahydrofolate deformylase [Planctomycetes bacterium]|nr:formyltetrahydrofolate deformylase [Planctomycetota bacterium]